MPTAVPDGEAGFRKSSRMVDSAARPVSSTEVYRREEHGAVDGAACRSKARQRDCRRTSYPGRSGSAEASERACSTTRGSGTNRSLAAQEEKWEAREKRLDQQLQEQIARRERLKAELLERRPKQEVSRAPEGNAVERAWRAEGLETAGVRRSPPPLVRCPDAMPSPDSDARGEQLSRDTPLQYAHTWNSIAQLHLPPIPEFSGEDQSLTNNSFQQWLEQFEMVSELAQWPENIKLKQLALCLRGPAQAYD